MTEPAAKAPVKTAPKSKVIMRVEGYDGQIELLADRVVIHRQGLLNMLWYGFNAKREIPLGAISEVGFKDASIFKQGEIEFLRSGSISVGKLATNKVKFPKKKNYEFEVFKDKTFELLNQLAQKRSQQP